MDLKSHFTYNRQQRSGILLLLLFIIVLLYAYWFVDLSTLTGRYEEDTFDTSSAEIMAIQREIDSLHRVEMEKRVPKIYPFNPNFITDFKGYTLGMSNEEIDRLLKYRESGNWINSTDDFKWVTGVSDSLLNKLSPYFKFPQWVTHPRSRDNFNSSKSQNGFTEVSAGQKMDLNTASEEQLQQVSGIGPALSRRIVAYRNKLGGFSSDVQLFQVYGLQEDVVKRALNLFTVKTPKEITKMDINTATASDIATIPGISFEMAKKIWEYRRLREKIETLAELDKIEGMTKSKLQLIQVYLSVD